MADPRFEYRFGGSNGVQPERDAQQHQAAVAQHNAQNAQATYMREFYARQAAEPPVGDVIDGEYTVVDVPLLGPPDGQADE